MNDLTEDQKRALSAFRKRVKINQREDDSKLGRSKLTGQHTQVVAIRPPVGFPAEVWQELKEKGYLKDDGGGFYALVPGKN